MNNIDALMDEDPLNLTPANIDAIIAFIREDRARLEGGGKATKETGPKVVVSLADLGLIKPKVAVQLKRRI